MKKGTTTTDGKEEISDQSATEGGSSMKQARTSPKMFFSRMVSACFCAAELEFLSSEVPWPTIRREVFFGEVEEAAQSARAKRTSVIAGWLPTGSQ